MEWLTAELLNSDESLEPYITLEWVKLLHERGAFMIDPKVLDRIKQTCTDAALGNTGMNCQIYAKDVGALLKERGECLGETSDLVLVKRAEVDDLRKRLQEALARAEEERQRRLKLVAGEDPKGVELEGR